MRPRTDRVLAELVNELPANSNAGLSIAAASPRRIAGEYGKWVRACSWLVVEELEGECR